MRCPTSPCLLLTMGVSLAGLGPSHAAVLRVNHAAVGPKHDGMSWQTAFTHVQSGLDVADAGDEVWVASGIYVENITLRRDVGLFGGFAGVESARDQRIIREHVTTLDGGEAGSVVTAIGSAQSPIGPGAILDGFTIQGGTGTPVVDGAESRPCGGGVYIRDASPMIRNNIIAGHRLDRGCGGGLYSLGSDATIADNLFIGNSTMYGGAIYCEGGAPVLTGNTLRDDSAGFGGGLYLRASSPSIWANDIIENSGTGIYCDRSSAHIRDNTISANQHGGAIYANAGSTLRIEHNVMDGNCSPDGAIFCDGATATITGNSITRNGGGGISTKNAEVTIQGNRISDQYTHVWGGGVMISGGHVTVRDNVISGNVANDGGGLFCWEGADVTITGNRFIANSAGRSTALSENGGAMVIAGASADIRNNLLYGNTADEGGGIYGAAGTILLTNNTLVYNRATAGGAILLQSDVAATLINNIIVGNQSGVSVYEGGLPILRTNCVFGNGGTDYDGFPSPTGQDGNIRANPMFLNPTLGDFHISAASPAHDSGEDAAVLAGERDVDGLPRIAGARVDMGAYEVSPFTMGEAIRALRIAGGLESATEIDISRLSVEYGLPASHTLALDDALRLVRRATLLDPLP